MIDTSQSQKQPRIISSLESLEKTVEMLDQFIDSFVSKVELVLSPEGPTSETVKSAPVPIGSPVANRIDSISDKLKLMSDKVEHHKRRVEL